MNIQDLGQNYKIVSAPATQTQSSPTNIKDIGSYSVSPQSQQVNKPSPGTESVIPGSSLAQNLKSVPGQVLGALGSVGDAITGGGASAIGQELGTTAKNIGLLAKGKNPNIPVNIPKLAGGILESGAAVAATGLPIASAPTAIGRIGQAAAGYGALGGIGGAGNALTKNGTASDVLESSAVGAGLGALGGAAGQGVSEAVQAIRSKPATLKDALDMTSPTLNKKTSISALENVGKPGGATQEGLLKTTNVTPSPRDMQVAQSVVDVVVPGKPIDTLANINAKIEDVAENQVRPFLQENPSPFNVKTLNAYIRDNTIIPNYIKADPVLERTYELTRQSMLDEVANNPKTMEGLWDSRISFDHVAENQVGSLNPTDTKVSVIKQAVLDTRRAVNDFIAENTPNAGADFKNGMQQINRMYDARTRIATANYKMLGQNAIQSWLKNNPSKANLIKYGLGAAGLGAAGKIGFDVMP